MTQLTVDVELDEHRQPVFRLTEAQVTALGLQNLGLQDGAARKARWEVQPGPGAGQSSLHKYIGIAPRLEEGSLEYYRQLKGHAD